MLIDLYRIDSCHEICHSRPLDEAINRLYVPVFDINFILSTDKINTNSGHHP